MSGFVAFLKKEIIESARSGKFTFLFILFVVFGIMNPAIAKLTPWLFEAMSEQLAESGMTVTSVNVDALTSWTQFFKNIPMALIAFILMYGGIFTKEYESGSLVLILSKGLSRYKIVLAKSVLMLTCWTLGYWLCFVITYGYNAYYWDNGIAAELLPAVFNWWLFGLFTVALTVLFSVLSKSGSGVLLGTGGSIMALYLVGLYPKMTNLIPTALMNSAKLLTGAESAGDYTEAVIITAVFSILCIAVSIPIFNKKQV